MPTLSPDEIDRLSPQERLSLIGQLWDSMRDSEVPLPPSQQEELARRLSMLDDDRGQAISWEQLRGELARRRP